MTKFPVLYKYTQKKQVQQWQIIVDGDNYYTIEGIKDGKLTTSLPTYCKGKSIGKKNETTPQEQALKDATSKYTKKKDSGYNVVLTEKKNFLEPMLAFEYEDYPIDWENEEVYTQPKLDGLRAINEDNSLMSRNGKPFIVEHLYQDEMTLDGELYNHKFKDDFNKITSLFKKKTRTPEELKQCEKLGQYWVYDLPRAVGGFDARYEKLLQWYADVPDERKTHFKIVAAKIVTSKEQLQQVHIRNLELGYEGTIIRRITMPYEFKRSKQLLKYKDFKDEEFDILDYGEGTGGRAGTIGWFWMHLDKTKPYHIDKDNDAKCVNVFKSNVKGNHKYLKEVWNNRDSYIGKSATVKYFNRTPMKEDGTGNKPRFPYIIKIDREEYE